MTSYATPSMALAAGWQQAANYTIDRWQRSILFWDIMRQRGNDYFANLRAGLPPALAFEYETILEARDFDPPVNYTLVKILDSRTDARDRRQMGRNNGDRRQTTPEPDRRPGTKAADQWW